MATAYGYKRAPFTYTWIIENFSELTYIDLKSPSFVIKSIGDTVWYLQIEENVHFYCHIRTNNFSVKECNGIDFEFSFLGADGSPVISKRSSKSRLFLSLLSRETFLERWAEFIPNNTLTVQCRMWRREHTVPTTDLCHARTKLKIYKESFVWAVKEFGALNSSEAGDFRNLAWNERKVYPLKPLTQKGPFMALILYLKRNSVSEDVYVDFLIEKGRDYVFSCEISVLNANGNMIVSKVARGRPYFSWTILRFWPLISKDKLISNKNLFLPNGTLFLKCSFEVCTGVISSEIEYCTPNVSSVVEEEEELLNFFAVRKEIDDLLEFEEYFIRDADEKDLDNQSVEEQSHSGACNNVCPLKAALRYLNSEATLRDVSLRIGTKLYPVHKNIICSRSPVFNTIFSKNMKENIIEINDMDENTLLRLLQYIYTDTVGDLQFENALDLFKAATDYQLFDLKERCSDFLIMNLCKTNVRDIHSLANECLDEKLENAARNFFLV
ncbi:hypothetical protein AVEN_114564-1 [Araneus ventricosus]|uniref:Speckle-type POZ protein n=1 Tax=Araneus ventricosus TaxID=182803 RepID=A0A4Y2M2E6_ARAVE|nr:hypothetical protein AVEN_114564-1 [Araneus ventricosus]